jgi:hypothetical protein
MPRKFQAELSLESIPRSTHYIGSLSVNGSEFAVQCHGREAGLKVMLAKVSGSKQDVRAREVFIPSQSDSRSPKKTSAQLVEQVPQRLGKMHPALRGVSIKLGRQT